MARPEPKPALKKAPRKEHPFEPNTPSTGAAPATDTPQPASSDSQEEATVQMNLRVPKSVRTAIKKAALEEDTTVSDWMLDAIRRKLDDR